MIMREGSVMLLCGVALGLLLAMAAGKVLSGILYDVGALDPIAFHRANATGHRSLDRDLDSRATCYARKSNDRVADGVGSGSSPNGHGD